MYKAIISKGKTLQRDLEPTMLHLAIVSPLTFSWRMQSVFLGFGDIWHKNGRQQKWQACWCYPPYCPSQMFANYSH